ncbi:PEP-CTERM protein-sorting domain-containing protein [Verrucomicrobium sp. GAS474]|uniref:beta strand repeat-containing protein n=1 Tax=Verrucomicrobium sp. GAS474 TaxID=1882831 RepID=UPI000879AF46|nr:PEP-CTERM sorting domain-containing protein [Verrucomicrobium sp. GAS474]SDT88559.1 PEP-CTERM protein-sorting domain-containing protein [Verrucomicrobium sp. GAS474]
MKTTSRIVITPLFRAAALRRGIALAFGGLALLLAPQTGVATTTATWNGTGVTGGTGNGVWSNLSNYTSSAAFSTSQILDFGLMSGTNTLSATAGSYDVGGISFGSTSASSPSTTMKPTLTGDGVLGDVTINLTGNITAASPAGSVATLGSDLILNLSNGIHTMGYASNPNVTATASPVGVLVINSLITGGGSGASIGVAFATYGSTSTYGGSMPLVLTNNNNSFDAAFIYSAVRGPLSYTSIGNAGVNSSLGNASAANSTIGIGNSSSFNYIGATSQTTNRGLIYGSTQISNYASSPSTLSFTGTLTATSQTLAGYLRLGVSAGNTLSFTNGFTDFGANSNMVTKMGTSSYYNASGVSTAASGTGTVILRGASTYTGGTVFQSASGTILVANTTGSGLGTGNVTFASAGGSTLGGTGIIALGGSAIVNVLTGNFISPGGVDGVAVGTLTFDGGNTTGAVLTMAVGAKFVFDLAASNASDKIVMLNYASNDLTLNANAFVFSGAQAGDYVLFQTYDSNGVLTDAGLSAANFSLATSTGLTGYTSSLDFGTTGEVILHLAAVPEPATWALLLGGTVFLMFSAAFRRRRVALA